MLTTSSNFRMTKIDSGIAPVEFKASTISNFFVNGLENERHKKIRNRKDAMLILEVQEKYSSVPKPKMINSSSLNAPYFKLRDGRNLFEVNPEEYFNLVDVYELSVIEQNEVILEYFSFLPNLNRLTVQFSKIYSIDLGVNYTTQRDLYFSNLEFLDLSFNNLTDENLELIKEIKSLKTLILMGNSLTANIPDLSSLINLEELNMSYNRLETEFINEGFSNPVIKEKKLVVEKNFLENSVLNNVGMSIMKVKDNRSGRENNISIENKSKVSKDFDANDENFREEIRGSKYSNSRISKNPSNSELKSNLVQELSNKSERERMVALAKIKTKTSKENHEVELNNLNGLNNAGIQGITTERLLGMKQKLDKDDSSSLNKENSEEDLKKLKREFEEWKKFLKTNLQKFFDNISGLKKLKKLNISKNKIKFFDIDPFKVKEMFGFESLTELDISYNLIEEGIAILLVMNLPALESIDITKNPIVEKRQIYEAVEYEIFKNKNIFLINKEAQGEVIPVLKGKKNVQIHQPYYMVKSSKVKTLSEFKKTLNKRLDQVRAINERDQKDIENEFNLAKDPGLRLIQDLKNQYLRPTSNNTEEEYENVEGQEAQSEGVMGNTKSNFFLTNDMQGQTQFRKTGQTQKSVSKGPYTEFLDLANKCFGKDRHYKEKLPLTNAYRSLRYVLNNLKTDITDTVGGVPNYLKNSFMKQKGNEKIASDYNNDFKAFSKISKFSGGKDSSSSFLDKY